MNQYTIDCTPEQTCKALELGAPIKHSYDRFEDADMSPICKKENKWLYAIIPIAEQMIGWLESRGVYVSVAYDGQITHKWESYNHSRKKLIDCDSYDSRKEATLAAIDAALDYLIKKKGV